MHIGVLNTDLTPKFRFWELLAKPVLLVLRTGVNCLDTLPPFLAGRELVALTLEATSHLKKSQPSFDHVLLRTPQLKKNRPKFWPGDWTIFLLDRLPHLHRGGVIFIEEELLPFNDIDWQFMDDAEKFGVLWLTWKVPNGVLAVKLFETLLIVLGVFDLTSVVLPEDVDVELAIGTGLTILLQIKGFVGKFLLTGVDAQKFLLLKFPVPCCGEKVVRLDPFMGFGFLKTAFGDCEILLIPIFVFSDKTCPCFVDGMLTSFSVSPVLQTNLLVSLISLVEKGSIKTSVAESFFGVNFLGAFLQGELTLIPVSLSFSGVISFLL